MNEQEKIELDARFFIQDHRIFPVLKRFFCDRCSWSKDDPRRKASTVAFVCLIFFSPATAAASAGIVAVLSFGALMYQNTLIRQQIDQQQLQITRQAEEHEAEEVRDAYRTILESGQSVPQLKRLSIAFLQSQRDFESGGRLSENESDQPAAREIDLHDANLDRVNFSGLTLRSLNLNQASFVEATFSDTTASKLRATDSTMASDMEGVQIDNSAFDRSEFRHLDDDVPLKISGEFAECSFTEATILNTVFDGVIFRKCVFVGTTFADVVFASVEFIECDLTDATVVDPTIQCTMFTKSKLVNVTAPKEFIDKAESTGALITRPAN